MVQICGVSKGCATMHSLNAGSATWGTTVSHYTFFSSLKASRAAGIAPLKGTRVAQAHPNKFCPANALQEANIGAPTSLCQVLFTTRKESWIPLV